jgi:hypothetical protein
MVSVVINIKGCAASVYPMNFIALKKQVCHLTLLCILLKAAGFIFTNIIRGGRCAG